jgi:hypothetical protein
MTPLGTISGSVKEDTNNDDTGDIPLSNVVISLVDSTTGIVIRTTLNQLKRNLSVYRLTGR